MLKAECEKERMINIRLGVSTRQLADSKKKTGLNARMSWQIYGCSWWSQSQRAGGRLNLELAIIHAK